MKRYEGLFILNSAAREESLKETIDKISAEIAAAGGKVETIQKMDKKTFARVADRKHSSGFYVNILFESEPAAVGQTAPPLRQQRGDFPRALHPGRRAQAGRSSRSPV